MAADDQVPDPISYTIDGASGVILEVWRGIVTAEDLRRYWQRLLVDPAALALRRTLVDVRESDIRFTGSQLNDLVMTVAIPMLAGRDWQTAIVVEHAVQFGVSRQYQVFAEQFSKDNIFRDFGEALTWLRQQGRG